MRLVLALVVVLVMGCAITGVGMGDAPAERQAAPAPDAVAAAQRRIAAGGAATARGRARFEDEGCDRCHSIAATGADGKLGPRLDTIDDDAEDMPRRSWSRARTSSTASRSGSCQTTTATG